MRAWFSPTLIPGRSTDLERAVYPAPPPGTSSPTPPGRRMLLRGVPASPVGISLPGGRRLLISPSGIAIRVIVLALVLFAGWCVFQSAGTAAKASSREPWSAEVAAATDEDAGMPNGPVFDFVSLVVVSTITGGALSYLADVTPLIGITWVAFAWANLTGSPFELTDGVTRFMRSTVSRVGLMVILARAGLSLDLSAAAADGARIAVLATIPLLAEATVHALVSNAIIGDAWEWCFLRGFLGAAIAPSVVVPGVLKAKASSWGRSDGPADAMLSSVVVESALAVWTISFLVDLAVPAEDGGRSVELTLGLGPVQFVAGPIVGAAVAIAIVAASRVLSVERGSKTPTGGLHKRVGLTVSAMLGVAALTLIYLGAHVQLAGGGSLAAVTTAAVASHILRRSGSPSQVVLLGDIQRKFTAAWDGFVLPALFSMLGSSIDAQKVFAASFLADFAPPLVSGVSARFVVTFLCALALPRVGSDDDAAREPASDAEDIARPRWCAKESLWVAVSSIGKASVQAAMGGAALLVALENLDVVRSTATASTPITNSSVAALSAAAAAEVKAREVEWLASLAAVVFAPLSALLMRVTGPSLLAV